MTPSPRFVVLIPDLAQRPPRFLARLLCAGRELSGIVPRTHPAGVWDLSHHRVGLERIQAHVFANFWSPIPSLRSKTSHPRPSHALLFGEARFDAPVRQA